MVLRSHEIARNVEDLRLQLDDIEAFTKEIRGALAIAIKPRHLHRLVKAGELLADVAEDLAK